MHFCEREITQFSLFSSTGKGMKEGVMNRDSTMNQYTNKTLCGGWDFCINEAKAAKRRHKNILQELQVTKINFHSFSLIHHNSQH